MIEAIVHNNVRHKPAGLYEIKETKIRNKQTNKKIDVFTGSFMHYTLSRFTILFNILILA